MATLSPPGDAPPVHLAPETLVGRSSTCDLRLTDPAASGQHAVLRFTGAGWEVRDLGSRNGTHLDGQRLPPGEKARLTRGARLGFGQVEPAWILTSDAPPVAIAVSDDAEVEAQGGMLTLPPGEEPPLATIYLDPGGQWVVERDGQPTPAGAEVEVAGRVWRLSLPQLPAGTLNLDASELSRGRLRFEVSADEETTHLSILAGGAERRLADRAHHYLLLTLARQRLLDREDGASPEEEGWMDRETLADGLRLDLLHVNVLIHRARRQLAADGVVDAARIVERRAQSGQLRLGVGDVEIVRL